MQPRKDDAVPSVPFGLLLPTGCTNELAGWSAAEAWKALEQFALAGDRLGYDYLWLGDHLLPVQADSAASGPLLEAWTTLAALASATARCRLGVFVSNMAFRSPALLARMALTLGGIAGNGRIQLGLGAGWFAPEHEPLGFTFGPPADRVTRLEQHVQAVRDAWSAFASAEEDSRLSGSADVSCPPVWIGGEGDVMLRRVVGRHADWSCFGGSEEWWAERRSRLLDGVADAHSDRAVRVSWNGALLIADDAAGLRHAWVRFARGEEYDSWVARNLVGTWPQVRAKIRRMVKIGCEAFIVAPADFPSHASIERLAANRATL